MTFSSYYPGAFFRSVWLIGLLVAPVSCLCVLQNEGRHRVLQVTGELDWSPSDAKNSYAIPPQDQRTQEQASFTTTTYPPETETWGDSTMMEGSSLSSTTSSSQEQQSSRVPLINILLLVLLLCGAIFVVLVLKRRQELARWREYRTHQILRAQDEAFDTNYDEAFDLELVEGSAGGTIS